MAPPLTLWSIAAVHQTNLLVHGAGGGVGLGRGRDRHDAGRNLIAAASSEKKLAAAKASGADHLVLTTASVPRRLQAHYRWPRCDLVFIRFGGDDVWNILRCIACGRARPL